jgi:hypothetical protein
MLIGTPALPHVRLMGDLCHFHCRSVASASTFYSGCRLRPILIGAALEVRKWWGVYIPDHEVAGVVFVDAAINPLVPCYRQSTQSTPKVQVFLAAARDGLLLVANASRTAEM